MSWLILTLGIAILIAINALYVAAEFATASARRSRLHQMSEEGNRLAGTLLPIVEKPANLDRFVATCQIGITLSSLLLGFYGQASLGAELEPFLSRLGGSAGLVASSISATAILLFLTTVQVLLGELVPKNIGVRYPEKLATLTVLPVRWSMALFRPLIWLFNGSGHLLLKLFGMSAAGEHVQTLQAEDILLLVQESSAGGVFTYEERMLLENALQLRGLTVRQIMTPRTAMFAAPVDVSTHDLFSLLADSPYSRLPLFDDDLDHIVGVVHLKDLLCLCLENDECDVRTVINPPYFLPESIHVDLALRKMQMGRQHLAIVLDEFGGTAGVVSMEDLIEEIFGEIQDEFDNEAPNVRRLPDGRLQARGETSLNDLSDWIDIKYNPDEYASVAGLVYAQMGRIPAEGERIEAGGLTILVEKMSGNTIESVIIMTHKADQAIGGKA